MFCFGTSHIWAVQEAAVAAGIPLELAHAKQTSRIDKQGRPVLLKALVERLEAHTGPIFSMVGGNKHNVFGLIRHRRPFDFIHPKYPQLKLDKGAEVIPYGAIRDVLERLNRRWLLLIGHLAELYPGRVVHIESPPQIRDDTYISQSVRSALGKANVQRRRGGRNIGSDSEFEVSSPELRFKLWRVNSEIFARTCSAARAGFLPAPPESMDGDGFLRREYWGNATHANSAYGALLLSQMKEYQP